MASQNSINNMVTDANLDVITDNINVGTAAPANPYDISIEKAVNGLIGISIQNTSAGGNAGSTLPLINEAATGDPALLLNVNGVSTFSLGIDNGDSDNLKLTTGASPSAGTEVLVASTAGALTMNGGQVDIGTNNAASAINIGQGTTARVIGMGNSAAPHTLVLGSVDTTATTTLQSGTTGLSVTATNGPLTVNSGTGVLGLSTDATAATVNIATGGGVKAATFGSTNTTSSTTVQSGSGALNVTSTNGAMTVNSGTGALGLSTDAAATTVSLATGGAVKSVTLGSTNTTSATTVQSGSGALNITATGGALTINSGVGALSVSNDASATTVTIATGGAAKTVTLGSTNTTSSLALQYGTADFTLASATGTVMSALDTGEIRYALQPCVTALVSALQADVTGDATDYTVIFNTEIFDQNSDYNNTTGVFTAPITGRYFVAWQITFFDVLAAHTTQLNRVITSNREWRNAYYSPGIVQVGSQAGYTQSFICDMDAADTLSVVARITGSTKTVDVNGNGSIPLTYLCVKLAA